MSASARDQSRRTGWLLLVACALWAGEVAAQKADEVLRDMKLTWGLEQNYFNGWESESPPAAGGKQMLEFWPTRTAELVRRGSMWLKTQEDRAKVKAVASDPAVKTMIDDVRKQRDAASAKLLAYVEEAVGQAEKMTLPANQGYVLTNLRARLTRALEGNPRLPEIQARLDKSLQRNQSADDAVAKGREDAYQQMLKSAEANWPEIVKRYPGVQDNFDPAKAAALKGKTVRLKDVRNRMGWDFTSSEFQFAATVNGVPVAGRYPPEVRRAIDDLYARTKQELAGDRHDLIGVVEGTGKINRIERTEGEVRVDGGSARVKGEREVPVDAVVLRVVALRAGPIAVGTK